MNINFAFVDKSKNKFVKKDCMHKGELDERGKRLPPSHGIHYFHKGLSVLANATGSEKIRLLRYFLGVL